MCTVDFVVFTQRVALGRFVSSYILRGHIFTDADK